MLKPTDKQIQVLAQREADPRHVLAFEPISKGPVFAVFALIVVGIISIPLTCWHILRRYLSAGDGPGLGGPSAGSIP